MPQTKEQLYELIEEAIPPNKGIVNFRVLRDVLAASIDYKSSSDSDGGGGGDAKQMSVSKRKIDDKIYATPEKRHKPYSSRHSSGRSQQNSKYDSNIKEFAGKLDTVLDRFDGLSKKVDKLNDIVKRLEKRIE